MKWLDEPRDEAERLLREGLDQAKRRAGDELTHRRVWAKVAEAAEMPEPRSRGRWIWASAAATVLVAAGAFSYLHFFHRSPLPAVPPVVAEHPQSPGTPAPEAPTAPAVSAETELVPLESERAPGHVVQAREGERVQVALGGGAVAALDENSAMTWDSQHRPAVQKGVAHLSVPHQPPGWRFSVTAGPYVVTVVGTKFDVRVSNHTVGVDVTEGVVEVWRNSHATRLAAGDSWHGPLYPDEPSAAPASARASAPSASATTATVPASARLSARPASAPAVAESPSERPLPSPAASAPAAVTAPASAAKPLSAATARGLQEAQAALKAGDASKAIEILSRTAQGTGPAAENAAYELGRITRYNLDRPRQAVALWDKYRTRFPNGLLRTETDLSIAETLSQMGEIRAALAETDAFLARHPQSERRHEVQRLAERLRAAQAAAETK